MVEEMMQVFSAVFYFLCGWILVLAVFMALLMLIYIVNAMVEQLYGINLAATVAEKIKRCRK